MSASTQPEVVTVTQREATAWVTLNRPERRNALDASTFEALQQIFDRLSLDPTVRAVVLSGAGGAFCAGLDLKSLGSLPAMDITNQTVRNRVDLIRYIEPWQRALTAIERCAKPVIAAIHGACIGGGLDLVAAADIRLASADAVFSLREVAVAMVADLGSLQRLPHIIGQGHTRDLAYTARDVDAQEALRMQLVNSVADDKGALVDAAEKLATQIAQQAPMAVQASKDVLNYSRDKSIEDGMHYALVRNSALLPSEHLLEAMQAFMEKRQPEFK